MTDRQKRVAADVRATLGARGALLTRGVYVRAFDSAHLDDVCAKVLGAGVKKPDAALHLVLLELQKTLLERKAAAEKAELGDTTTRRGPSEPRHVAHLVIVPQEAAEIAAAEGWFEVQPDHVRAEIERKVNRTCPPNRAPDWRATLQRDAVVDAYRARPADDGAAKASA